MAWMMGRVMEEMKMAANIEMKALLWFRPTRSMGSSVMREIKEV